MTRILRATGEGMSAWCGAQVLFRSVSKLLMDTATAEYLFCCDFFQEDTIFTELFTPTLAVVESSLAASIQVPAPLLSLSVLFWGLEARHCQPEDMHQAEAARRTPP